MGTPAINELLERARRDDRDALNGLVTRLYGIVWDWFRVLSGDPHRSSDLTQEVFAVFCRRGPYRTARDVPALVAWLREATRRTWLGDARSRRRDRGPDGGGRLVEVPAPEPEPPDVAERNENVAVLRLCLAELSAELREVLVLSAIRGLAFRTIAEQLGTTEETARWRAWKARARLVELLDGMKPGLAERVGRPKAPDRDTWPGA
ncbi:ECF RNA polymerase sigma factor SigE [Gemmata obscuriglobus]|uniref:RNA polymerase sigma factor 70 region 4 type 2 domain-containing protein n=1 Tax=Gemmata obscuriglobus TaxID=114 RepID=A0A2Z3H5I4_9BACT|nr:sigma-70 family RNA polymerase sigma factor [Gemmata obscuriglobus]AWM40141.1 hypothetical protein C1280_26140 [Gemmata obscuriglobus]QEG26683.1 ECF RNA polymerase sigma factor SigE [Gemmata obscuriglobus]VTS02338.1 hypothetical protein : RNA polymerase, sigma-24 subunit, ECF subfamily OS=Desulfotomaculum carboxydivorans (strain DSM 14880 / VKM B-2319 / CO-1-SRB) GN=Desca_1679 PE=4 SV=1: Sigma70_r4_2 [Gemmata obscuriglobus UQM 2246]